MFYGIAWSAIIHGPESLFVISDVQHAIPRIMALAAIRAGDEAADVHALVIEVFPDSEGRATTARDQEKAIAGWRQGFQSKKLCAHGQSNARARERNPHGIAVSFC